MKKWQSLFLTALLILALLVGCAPNTTDVDTTTTQSTQSTDASTTLSQDTTLSMQITASSSQDTSTSSQNDTTASQGGTISSDGTTKLTKTTTSATAVSTTTKQTAPKGEPILTFVAMSDTHIGAQNTTESMNRVLTFANSLAQKPEAYLFVGDLTDTTGSTQSSSQASAFKAIYEKYGKPEQMLYCLGPTHDVPVSGDYTNYQNIFRNAFGGRYFANDTQSAQITAQGIRHTVIDGFHFFSVDWNSTNDGLPDASAMSWLKEQLDAATAKDKDKPIFVITHVPEKLDAVFQDYPQVICFTGHLHNSAAREDSITQEGHFTNIHCGGVNYYRVDGYNRFYDDPFLNLGDIYAFAQAIYVQVYADNTVSVKRLDGYNGEIIGKEWLLGPGRYNDYTNKRIKKAQAATFTKDATLKVVQTGSNTVEVSFDAAKAGDAGPVSYYQVKLLTKKSGKYTVLDHKEIASQQVFYPNDKGIPDLYYKYTFTGVDLTDYAIEVTARDCWKESGNALVYTNGSYVSSFAVGGKVDFTHINAHPVTFQYDESQKGTSRYTQNYSMAVRFHPTQKFTDVKLMCSSWADTVGTLDFTLYKWNTDYATTVAGKSVDTFSLVGYKGSTVYTVFDGTYDAGEYLIVITTPNHNEGVGLYHYPLASGEKKGYLCYENGKLMNTYLYFAWMNTTESQTPFVVYP